MCTFVTYIFPPNCPLKASGEFFAKLGIRARPVDLSRFSPTIRRDESGWVRSDNCDCGTIIGIDTLPDESTAPPADLRGRYRRKGWSDAKIDRALADKLSATDHARTFDQNQETRWKSALHYLESVPSLLYLRVFWHHYDGLVDSEDFPLKPASVSPPLREMMSTLRSLPENTILSIFLHGRGGAVACK